MERFCHCTHLNPERRWSLPQDLPAESEEPFADQRRLKELEHVQVLQDLQPDLVTKGLQDWTLGLDRLVIKAEQLSWVVILGRSIQNLLDERLELFQHSGTQFFSSIVS